MPIAASLKKLFIRHQANYQLLYCKRTRSLYQVSKYLDIPTKQIIKSVVVHDKYGYALVVLPLESQIDFSKLNRKTKRNFLLTPDVKSSRLFFDCEPGCIVPFGTPYKLDMYIDTSVTKNQNIFFNPGCFNVILELSMSDFLYVNSKAKRCNFIKSDLDETDKDLDRESDEVTSYNYSSKILEFPKLPEVANKLLDNIMLGCNIDDIIDSFTLDKELNNQINTYVQDMVGSNSSYSNLVFNSSSNDKFNRFNAISHFVLGNAVNEALAKNKSKQESISDYWKHVLFAASLVYKIATEINNSNDSIDIDPVQVYVAAFMHNIGFLILASMFYPEFKLLRKWHLFNINTSIEVLEKRLLGMGRARYFLSHGHALLGANLLEYWGVPEYLIISAKYHHKPKYSGKYCEYVHIIQLANKLLATKKIGDETPNIDSELYQKLGISETRSLELLEEVVCLKSTKIDPPLDLTN